MRRLLLLAIITFALKHHTSKALECALPNQIGIRIFNSIEVYQANKIPFNPLSPGWRGSNVEFNLSALSVLEKNTFNTYDSQHIVKMTLSSKQIDKIDDGAFIALDCLHELLLDHNNVTRLTKKVFVGLHSLQTLDLSNNRLENLQDLVFAPLGQLRVLQLSRNQIRNMESLAFANLTFLDVLNLEFNQIATVDSDVFKPLKILKTLILGSNRLAKAQPEQWRGLDQLENLNVASNGLNHFDPSYNFSFNTLNTLNLSSNFLTMLNVDGISKHLPNLKFVDLNNNFWVCKDLANIIHELDVLGIKYPSARNGSFLQISGIACSEVAVTFIPTTQVIVETSTTMKNIDVKNEAVYVERIVEKKIKESNEKVLASVSYLQHLVIFLYVVVSVFITFEIFVRVNWCQQLYARCRGGRGMYFDNRNVENFSILHP